ncbi:MAG: isochorismatase family protein [Sedimentisphaerales bacterium]|nr:isochorismatase family protein [Sedimentisphaerales bacterium]
MKEDMIFWDVDTQYDFMQPDGRLYVPGAETIISNVSDVRRFALEGGYSMIADIDWHSYDNTEISDEPDFKETFPPHCMAGEPGSERIGFLGDVPIRTIPIDEMDDGAIRELLRDEQFHIVIRKNSLDVFDNPNTDKLVRLIEPKRVIVFGVALDFCVYYVVKGLCKFPDIRICVLKDAVKGLEVRPKQEIFDEFKQMGVEITELDAFVGRV